MDLLFTISANAWSFAYMLIAIAIPVLIISKLLRMFGSSAKKTVLSFKK